VRTGFQNVLETEAVNTADDDQEEVEEAFVAARSDVAPSELARHESEKMDLTLLSRSLEVAGAPRDAKEAILRVKDRFDELAEEAKKSFALIEEKRPKKAKTAGHSILDIKEMRDIALKLREGKIKRSAGLPTVTNVCNNC
jgi:hypothetical protein